MTTLSKPTVQPTMRVITNTAQPNTAIRPRLLRAAAYCRVSTEQEMQENSYERQCDYFRQMIENAPHLTLVGVYGDFGKSGRSIHARPELQRLLADCEAGKIDIVFVKSISRFARSMSDCLAIVRRLRELKIPVVFEKENINTMDGMGELLISVMASIAQEESNSISENMRWSIEQHNAKGTPYYHPSYGYRKAEKGSLDWVIDEQQAKVVRCAFDMALERRSSKEIVDKLNEMEVAAKTATAATALEQLLQSKKYAKPWNRRRVVYLLKNIAYIGDYLTNRTYIVYTDKRKMVRNKGEHDQYYLEGHHEAIVSKEQFEQVQTILKNGEMERSKRTACGQQKNK